MLENSRSFALGEHPTAPSTNMIWVCCDDRNGQRQHEQYEWRHYSNDLAAMEKDFSNWVKDYQWLYHVGIVQTEVPGLYKYYSTQQPVDIGTSPKPPHNAQMRSSTTISTSPWRTALFWRGASDLHQATDRTGSQRLRAAPHPRQSQ